jgi:hypothetical protein
MAGGGRWTSTSLPGRLKAPRDSAGVFRLGVARPHDGVGSPAAALIGRLGSKCYRVVDTTYWDRVVAIAFAQCWATAQDTDGSRGMWGSFTTVSDQSLSGALLIINAGARQQSSEGKRRGSLGRRGRPSSNSNGQKNNRWVRWGAKPASQPASQGRD